LNLRSSPRLLAWAPGLTQISLVLCRSFRRLVASPIGVLVEGTLLRRLSVLVSGRLLTRTFVFVPLILRLGISLFLRLHRHKSPLVSAWLRTEWRVVVFPLWIYLLISFVRGIRSFLCISGVNLLNQSFVCFDFLPLLGEEFNGLVNLSYGELINVSIKNALGLKVLVLLICSRLRLLGRAFFPWLDCVEFRGIGLRSV
jgi:hypothetical protein